MQVANRQQIKIKLKRHFIPIGMVIFKNGNTHQVWQANLPMNIAFIKFSSYNYNKTMTGKMYKKCCKEQRI
jgi:hypothetical protein